jgi:hypothetical protein
MQNVHNTHYVRSAFSLVIKRNEYVQYNSYSEDHSVLVNFMTFTTF